VDTDIDDVLNREHRSAPSRRSMTEAVDDWLEAFLDWGMHLTPPRPARSVWLYGRLPEDVVGA